MSKSAAESELTTPPKLLLVDDRPENLDILIEYLEQHGYVLSVTLNGEEALKVVEKIMPDVILLDVMMPGIDGFETCRKLKKNIRVADIPVIFMTALSDNTNKLEGFDAGGVDYITKPIHQDEVYARIKTHLTLQRHRKELQAKNKKLEELNQEKNEFLSIAAHDLKNPLSLILDHAVQLKKLAGEENIEHYNLANTIHTSAENMFQLITNLLDINRLDSGKTELNLQPMNVVHSISYVIEAYRTKANLKNQQLYWTPPAEHYIAEVDEMAFHQVLNNLVSNAIKYSPPGKSITLSIRFKNNYIQILVQDQGLGITSEDKQLLFNKFARLSARPTGGENSTGLGLSIVKRMMEGMKGRVWAESEGRNQGSCFYLEFANMGNLHGASQAFELNEQTLIFPEAKYIATILENAEIGDITGLQETVQEIEALGELYEPFVRNLKRYLHDFRFREIREWLGKQL